MEKKRLAVFGGDARMLGAIEAAKRAGWETAYVTEDAPAPWEEADVALLPWPHSFRDGLLAGTQVTKERALSLLPTCRVTLFGAGVGREALMRTQAAVNPAQDEGFLRANAALTAEGAIAKAMERPGRALLSGTCLITGGGRIAQELIVRLTAMGAFVIACARNEAQMQRAHAMGAHPVHLEQLSKAAAQADVVFNTVPARIFGAEAIERFHEEALYIELASAPYGADLDAIRARGAQALLLGGLPGQYAPMDAGAALFDCAQRALKQSEGGSKHG